MRRRTFAGALAGGLLASASASCAAPGSSGTGRPGDPIVLTLLSHYDTEPLKSALQAPIDEWNRTHDSVKVRTITVDYPNLLTTLMVRQTAGQGADIIHPYCLWAGQLVQGDVLQPAPPEYAAEIRHGYSRAAVEASSVGGKVYGYPTEVQTYALFYNKRLLRQAGIDHPPRTWQELEQTAYKTTNRDQHGNTLTQGFGLSTADALYDLEQTLALLNAAGGSFLAADGNTSTIDSPAGRAVLDLERRLITKGASSPAVDIRQAFPSGLAAMYISGGWETATLKAMMGSQYSDIGTAPLPGLEPGDRSTLATCFMLGVNSQTRHPRQAWEFLHWLNAEKIQAEPPSGMGGSVTATRMSVLQTSAGSLTGRADDMHTLLGHGADPNTQPFVDALAYAKAEPNGPHAQQAEALLRQNIQSVFSGQQSVDEALRTARRQIDQLASTT